MRATAEEIRTLVSETQETALDLVSALLKGDKTLAGATLLTCRDYAVMCSALAGIAAHLFGATVFAVEHYTGPVSDDDVAGWWDSIRNDIRREQASQLNEVIAGVPT